MAPASSSSTSVAPGPPSVPGASYAPGTAGSGEAPAVLDASVVILCSRPACLRRCLASLRAASEPGPREVLAVLNGRDAECAAVVSEFAAGMPGLRALRGAPRSLGGARNGAMREALGEWMCCLDDDVSVPPGYFAELEAAIRRHPEACAVGGPDRTPPGSPLFERCVGHTLGSWLGAGRFRRRTGGCPSEAWADDRAFILCNLAFHLPALRAEGLAFDERLARCEENLLLQRLLRAGRRALHAPGLFVFHRRRSSLRGFFGQCYMCGKGRGEMTWKLPASLRPVHLAPALLAASAACAAAWPRLLLPVLAGYAAAAAANALVLRRRHREGWAAAPWLWVLVPTGHLGYAAGLLAGLASGLARRLRRD